MENRGASHSRWIIVGVNFTTLALVYTVMYSFSIFFVALLKEFGWSRSITAGAFSLVWILHGFIGPFAGSLTDRFGSRRVFLLGSLILGTGLALCSLTQSWWQFYLFFGVITAAGIGSTGWVPNTTVVQNWFREKRGLAMGIISSGAGIGIFVCGPLTQFLISRVGWRVTYRIMALSIPLIVISTTLIFLRKQPPPTQPDPAEGRTLHTPRKDPFAVDRDWTSRSWTLGSAISTKQFWILSTCFFFSGLILQSIMTHQVAFFVDQGMQTMSASYIAGTIGVVSIVGKIFWGTLSDRIGREVTYTLVVACSVLGIVALIAFTVLPSPTIPYSYAVSFGMGYAGMTALPPLITADFFEGRAYGRIFGALYVLNGVGAAFGAWFTGFLYDHLQSYVPSFVIVIVCDLIVCLILWIAAPRKIRIVPGKAHQIR
jgi:MFS family permease